MTSFTKQNIIILLTGLLIIAGGSLVLGHLGANQRLSPAPVKIINQPMIGRDSTKLGTNNTFIVGTNMIYLPEKVLNYSSEIIPVDKAEYDTLPKDTTFGRRLYKAEDGFQIINMVVLMGADRTSIHRPQYCLEGTGWRIDSIIQTNIYIDKPQPYLLPVNKLSLSGKIVEPGSEPVEKRGIFIYWYIADGIITADHKSWMFSVAKHRLLHGEVQRWAYVIYFSVCQPGEEEHTFERMKEFIRASLPEYQLVYGKSSG